MWCPRMRTPGLKKSNLLKSHSVGKGRGQFLRWNYFSLTAIREQKKLWKPTNFAQLIRLLWSVPSFAKCSLSHGGLTDSCSWRRQQGKHLMSHCVLRPQSQTFSRCNSSKQYFASDFKQPCWSVRCVGARREPMVLIT